MPSSSNPTYSLSYPGPAAVGVPNFFIDSFQIPPFLIPIYEAAGTEYDVPWSVLAAINEIETDYGRNLSVSSAGAVGWMQFLPSTWRQWGVDATGSGIADPYNPVDAIFSAARYLHAAGASTNLARAIFAYNHANWYVQSVLLRAQLIGDIPSSLVGALGSLVEGHFPVAAPAEYADQGVDALAGKKVKRANPAITVDSTPGTTGTAIYARKGSPVIAVNDGRIIKLGYSLSLGRYIELQDATGNVYTYAHLGSVTRRYPVPKGARIKVSKVFTIPASRVPTAPATAGSQVAPVAATTSAASTTRRSARAGLATSAAISPTLSSPLAKERLFARPNRPASYASGGDLQVHTAAAEIASFRNYFSDALHRARNQYTLKRLRIGSIVVAGTILGRIGGPSQGVSPHLWFMIQPAGRRSPYIDPKPVLDGWKLLEATAIYRANGLDPFAGPGAKNPTAGQVLLMSKQQLTERVLHDSHVGIYACGRRDISAGLIDRRVLATIEFLSASGLDPYVSGLECGHSASGANGVDAAGATGASVDISRINGIPVLGHQGAGSITDETIRRLLTLQGAMAPDEIVSDMAYRSQPTTLALSSHRNRIQIVFTPAYGTGGRAGSHARGILTAAQWERLVRRIGQIPEPVVPIAPSRYAIKVAPPTAGH
ncbi:MAG: lytic murein transglycosylase [Solirubrobacteraceae bacterium]